MLSQQQNKCPKISEFINCFVLKPNFPCKCTSLSLLLEPRFDRYNSHQSHQGCVNLIHCLQYSAAPCVSTITVVSNALPHCCLCYAWLPCLHQHPASPFTTDTEVMSSPVLLGIWWLEVHVYVYVFKRYCGFKGHILLCFKLGVLACDKKKQPCRETLGQQLNELNMENKRLNIINPLSVWSNCLDLWPHFF